MRCIAGVWLGFCALLVSTGVAWGLSWSGPMALGGGSPAPLISLSCPTATECVGLDGHSRIVVFDPANPDSPTPVPLDPATGLAALACPSATQCTALTGSAEITFNPQALATPASASRPVPIGTSAATALTCPSIGLCVAVSRDTQEVSFDPTSPGTPPPVSLMTYAGSQRLGSYELVDVACSSTTQCTTLTDYATEITFDPAQPTPAVSGPVDPVIQQAAASDSTNLVYPAGLACQSASQCVMLDTQGNAVSFDPSAPGSTAAVSVFGSATATGEACETPTCGIGETASALSCPTASECVATAGSGETVTFAPAAPAPGTGVNVFGSKGTGGGAMLACVPAGRGCVAGGQAGNEVAFSASAPAASTPFTVDEAGRLALVACAGARQCTAMTGSGGAVTFNPAAPGTPVVGQVITRSQAPSIVSLACPATTRCVAVGPSAFEDYNQALTFTPRPPYYSVLGNLTMLASQEDTGYTDDVKAVACARTECSALDSFGELYGFAVPGARKLHSATYNIQNFAPPGGGGPTAVSCPSASQCTAVEGSEELTYDPSTLKHLPKGIKLTSGTLTGVACPTTTLCVAVGASHAIRFDPRAAGKHAEAAIDQGGRLTALACPSTSFCVAVDNQGRELSGKPSELSDWTGTTPPDAVPFTDVACGSPRSCVAIDSAGDAFLGARQGG